MKNITPTQEVYGILQHAYSVFNDVLFQGKLPECVITMQRQANAMGYYAQDRFYNVVEQMDSGKETYVDEIAINPDYFADHPPEEIMKTLVHEQVHVWQRYYGTPSRTGYHNKEWAAKMEEIGLMPSSTGKVGGAKTGQSMNEYYLPNGLFINVYRELFPDGHNIKWYDYWTQRKKALQAEASRAHEVILSASTEIYQNNPSDSESEESGSDNITSPIPVQELFPVKELQDKEEELRAISISQGNRLKYSCPKCKVNVWGKAGLNIRCNKCQKTFQYNIKIGAKTEGDS